MTAVPNLRGRSLLTLHDLRDTELLDLIALGAHLKLEKACNAERRLRLDGKNICLVFQKSSTRTRCAAMVAANDEGAHAEYLGSQDIHLGHKESIPDTARVLGRMFDGILYRGFEQSTVEELARCAGVPVWNGLTDLWHPTQIVADLLTMRETFGELRGLTTVFVGDGRNNVCNSLMLGCAKTGVHFVNCCPRELAPDPELVRRAQTAATANNSSIRICHDPANAIRGANVVYTDVWVSMGEEAQFEERLQLLRPFQVDMDMMGRTGNVSGGRLMFLHCLPAFHNHATELTRATGALEVTDEVFEAPFSKVFDQAENRMHTIKAIMVATLT